MINKDQNRHFEIENKKVTEKIQWKPKVILVYRIDAPVAGLTRGEGEKERERRGEKREEKGRLNTFLILGMREVKLL